VIRTDNLPLISIGVPTYNRPQGLYAALDAITRQTYANIEIIVSDNCTPGEEVHRMMTDFCRKDPRIKYYRQEKNLGIKHNFEFVLENAKADYFMWAADDDKWLDTDLLMKLFAFAPSNILTFPDAAVKNLDGTLGYPLKVYENCQNPFEYSKAFCSTGDGYPFYGLYNLPLFHRFDQQFRFDDDLKYYGEGTFLHKLFLAGPVKYVKDVRIEFSTASSKPSYPVLIDCFIEYFKRTVLIYSLADLTAEQKTEIMDIIFRNYTTHFRALIEGNLQQAPAQKLDGKRRVKQALKVLIKGSK
jgi:glycosyltransferase involved in cell wall biosynthesis